MRTWLMVGIVVAIVGVTATGLVVLESRDRQQGFVPDRIQKKARDAVDPGAETSTPVPPARCPAELAGCQTVSGRILYVESVDPDGDGDAHFVLADPASITGPGITVVDVAPDLRPNPLPGAGASVNAAGTVASGSYGQSQIEAVAFEAG